MRTLKQDINRYLALGVQPRTYVRIVDDTTGEELLMLGTKVSGDYGDGLSEGAVITQSIDPSGGLAQVSGCTIKNLILDEDFTLSTNISIPPLITGVTAGAGRLLKQGAPYGPYADVRNAEIAEYASPAITVGRNYNTGTMSFTVWRAPLEFTIPTALETCEDAYIALTGMGLYSATALTMYAVAGTWTSPITSGAFNDFTGWAASGNYTVANLIETWTTDEYGDTVYLRLNEAGRAAIASAHGGIFRIMLLSSRDADFTGYGTGPTGNEFVQFEASSSRLNLQYNTKSLDNQKAEIYFALEPEPSSYTGMDLIWTGVVSNYEINDEFLTLELDQNDLKKDCMIPSGVINGTGIYDECSDEIMGKALPVIYGDCMGNRTHREAIGYVENGEYAGRFYGSGDYVKAYTYTLIGAASGPNFIEAQAAGHALKEVDLYPASYDSSLESFAAINGDVSLIETGGVNAGRFMISKGNEAAFPYYLTKSAGDVSSAIQPFICKIPSIAREYHDLIINPENAIDSDPDNWMIVNAMANGVEPAVEFTHGEIYGPSTLYERVFVVFESLAPNGYTNNSVQVNILVYDDVFSLHLVYGGNVTTNGQHIIEIPAEHVYAEGRIIIDFNGSGLPAGVMQPVWIRNLCICRGYKASLASVIYIGAKGRMYESWITGRTGGKVSGDLIENAAHVIEAFARNEMSLATADVNTASFDAAYTAVGNAVLAFQLLERRRARELLKEMGKQTRLCIWWDETDALKCWRLDSTKHYPHSGTDIPAALDTFDLTGTPVNGVCTTHPMRKPVRLYRDSQDTVKNDFVMYYGMNYATGEFTKTLTVNKSEHNIDEAYADGDALQALCLASYNEIKTVNTYEIEAWAIRDDETAALVLDDIVRWLTTWHWKADVAADIDAVEYEMTDFINIRDDRIYAKWGTAVTERKKWMIVNDDVDATGHEYDLTAVAV